MSIDGFYDTIQLFYIAFDTWRLKSCQHTKSHAKSASDFQPRIFHPEKYVNKRRFVTGTIKKVMKE